METTTTRVAPMSTLQMVGIILIANTAVRVIGRRAATTVVSNVIETVTEETTE